MHPNMSFIYIYIYMGVHKYIYIYKPPTMGIVPFALKPLYVYQISSRSSKGVLVLFPYV